MTDRPILMAAPSVNALRAGEKTQTRHLAWGPWKVFTDERGGGGGRYSDFRGTPLGFHNPTDFPGFRNPTIWQKVQPGDRLWVKEAWTANLDISEAAKGGSHWWYYVKYAADGAIMNWPRGNPSPKLLPKDEDGIYRYEVGRPSIYIPRWASRLTLIVTEARIERVQEISEEAVEAEGVEWSAVDPQTGNTIMRGPGCVDAFAALWDSLHKPGNRWADNPVVVVLTFEVIGSKNLPDRQGGIKC